MDDIEKEMEGFCGTWLYYSPVQFAEKERNKEIFNKMMQDLRSLISKAEKRAIAEHDEMMRMKAD